MFGLNSEIDTSFAHQSTNTTGTNSGLTTNNQTGSGTNTNTTFNTGTNSGLSQAIQDPLATQFRQGLFSSYGKAINAAQNGPPIYGTGFVAGAEGTNAKEAANQTDSLKQILASTGGLDSGAFASGASNIASANMNQNAQLRAQLPAMEAQAQSARLNPLLAGAASLAGQAPTSVATTGSASQYGEGESSYKTTLDDIINQIMKSSMNGSGSQEYFGAKIK